MRGVSHGPGGPPTLLISNRRACRKNPDLKIERREGFRHSALSLLRENIVDKRSAFWRSPSGRYLTGPPAMTQVDYFNRAHAPPADKNPQYCHPLSCCAQSDACAVPVNKRFNLRRALIVTNPEDIPRRFMGSNPDFFCRCSLHHS